ncbi:MAG: glycosyltransferase [Geobacter sp.]|nr:glycosyltransferase [Geobacter sp.]
MHARLPQPIRNWLNDLTGKKPYHRYSEKETRKNRIIGQILAIATVIAALFYLGFCIAYANWDVWYAFIPFIIADTMLVTIFMVSVSVLWYKRRHHPGGLEPDRIFTVDIFIPVCREPLSIVEPTVAAAVALDYPAKTVHLLDDGEDDRLKELAERYGINYIRHANHSKRKAGNLNNALGQTKGELILALDADQVARPDLIRRVIGYFRLPHIGFVQTAQQFQLPEEDPWGNADNFFYKEIQAGRDNDNAAISCGSGVMYRRSALESIGGFSEWNMVEDVHTSMCLHDKGWHSVYVDKPYTRGTAPADVTSQLKQRWQWAVDSLRILFWDNPFQRKGLSFSQKIQYIHFGWHYIVIGVFLPIFFIIPPWALFTHKFILTVPAWVYIVVRLPYFVLQVASNHILSEKVDTFKTFQAQAELFACYFDATMDALRARKTVPPYTVSSKVILQANFGSRLLRCLPHIAVFIASATAIVYGLMTIHDDPWFLVINLYFCLWAMLLVWKFIILALWPKFFVKWG